MTDDQEVGWDHSCLLVGENSSGQIGKTEASSSANAN